MKLHLRYFASLREALGPGETIDAGTARSVAELREALIARGGRFSEALQRGRLVRCAFNQRMCDESEALVEGAEIAFFPPVTGG